MYNWSTDEEALKKYPEYYEQWKLEQLINFGLGERKISAALLKHYWPRLEIDPERRKFLDLLLHGDNRS